MGGGVLWFFIIFFNHKQSSLNCLEEFHEQRPQEIKVSSNSNPKCCPRFALIQPHLKSLVLGGKENLTIWLTSGFWH